jgi:hypothetical protein
MGRPIRYDGRVTRRKGTKFWWMYYRKRDGTRQKESTLTEDWNEANKKLRERLQARDGNILEVVRKGETLTFGEWKGLFLENYSKPPIRQPKTFSQYASCEASEQCVWDSSIG